MKRAVFLIVFCLICGADLIAVWKGIPWLEWVAKPLIVFSLMIYYISHASHRSIVLILALFFCWLGDLLLLLDQGKRDMMIFGLLAFLMANVLFILSYYRHRWTVITKGSAPLQKIRIAFPVILAGMGLVVILYPGLGALQIPVVMYAVVLTSMVVAAVLRMGRTTTQSFVTVLGGALLFMLSDSLLALDKFHQPLEHASVWIMITYCTSQYLIVEGILIHPLEN